MPVTSAMSRRTKTKTPTIQPAHLRTVGVTTLRSSSMVWRVKRPMAMNGLVIVFIPETMRRAGMESPSPAREQQGRGYGKSPLHARGRAGPWPNACSPARNHPCMRGEEFIAIGRFIRQTGIIPACAGKSIRAHALQSTGPNHPRMRGEEPNCSSVSSCASESPPHARGRGSVEYASGPLSRNHPPHARGRGRRPRKAGFSSGITPACAGKRVMKMRPPRT